MKLLYCHDNVYFKCENGIVYSQGQFPYSYFGPLLDTNFENITVVGRGRVLSPQRSRKNLNVSSGPNVKFELMPNINSPNGLIKYRKRVDRALKTLVEQHDAVVIRAVSDLGWLVYKHAKAMNKPISMEMSACAWDSTWNHGNPLGKIYAPIRMARDKIIAKNAHHVMYVSQSFLQKRYPTDAYTASASNVRIEKPETGSLNRRLKKINNKCDNAPITIGLIGTLSHKLKGIHTALHALKRIEEKTPGRFVFRILGPGCPEKYKTMTKKLGLEHCVRFDGVIQTGQAVLDWLENIDMYIQPSFQEGVPRATIEAMSTGCPCIGSAAGGIPELLSEEWLHTPGNHRELEKLIFKMITDKNAMLKEAEKNFLKSNYYSSEILTPIREHFWQHFAEFTESSCVNTICAGKQETSTPAYMIPRSQTEDARTIFSSLL